MLGVVQKFVASFKASGLGGRGVGGWVPPDLAYARLVAIRRANSKAFDAALSPQLTALRCPSSFVRKNGFSVTVSARALNVASFNSLSGFDHHDGTNPQRIGMSS